MRRRWCECAWASSRSRLTHWTWSVEEVGEELVSRCGEQCERCRPMALSRSAALSTPAATRYGGGSYRIWLEPSIGDPDGPDAIRRIRYRLGYPQLGRKPSSARVNSLFGRERPGDCFQLDAGPKCSNTPPSMTTLAMGSSDCIHRKPSDQPYVLHDVPHHAPVSHPRTTGRQRHRIPTLICVHRLTGGCGRAILNLDVRCRTGKSNGVIVSMKRNYWSSRHLPSSHNVRRGFFTRSAIIVLQRIT
jgi:hypothetical protein